MWSLKFAMIWHLRRWLDRLVLEVVWLVRLGFGSCELKEKKGGEEKKIFDLISFSPTFGTKFFF